MACRGPSAESGKLELEMEHARTNGCLQILLTTLTARERQIVRLVSKGLSNREVASRLNLTEGTIKAHLHNIYQKLAINNRTALAALVVFLSW